MTSAIMQYDMEDATIPRQLQEGGLHSCEGLLCRKRQRVQTRKVNKDKQKWFKLEPARRGKDVYQLTESQGEDQSLMAKLVLSLPASAPSTVRASSVTTDATSRDFTAFNIHHGRSRELLSTFKAEDIVQQRGFMAALGASGPGLFSQPPTSPELEARPEYTKLQELLHRQRTYNAASQKAQSSSVYKNVPKSFPEALKAFPSEFYFPGVPLPPPVLPGVSLAEFDPSIPLPAAVNQQIPCTGKKVEFRPPHGAPTNYPSIIGSGAGAGLKESQMAVWDQENEIYYFIDCSKKLATANDPREKKTFRQRLRVSQITVQKGQSEKGLKLPPCEPAIVKATAERGASKPHGCVLKASGKKGRHGMSALPSSNGEPGVAGFTSSRADSFIDGGDGGDGTPGHNGRHAEPGEDGGMGKNVIVELYGDARELGIDGTCQSVARLGGEDYEEVLLVDCSGGDGGDGGNGGRGGKGGDGGDGGRSSGGGDGGHGGAGGRGGRGGTGGSAGRGGRGGNCIIKAADPNLMILVEVNCNSGRPGKPGRGGKGGNGGKMGLGGASSVCDNESGLLGKPGRSGISGEDGLDGELGLSHRPGNVQWVITTEDGEELHSASTRFEAEVVSMDVTSCGQDGVFLPHQQLQVTNITVVNSGGLPLPAGAKVSIPSTETVRFDSSTFTLPQMEPGEEFTVPTIFTGRIVDEPSPNSPGPLTFEAKFAPRVDLLGRSFEKSQLEQTLTVQYPISLAYTLARKNISEGEITTIEVGIQNSSPTASYGTRSSTKGSVLVHILLDPKFRPLGFGSNYRAGEFVASQDPNNPNSIFVLIKELKPGATLSIPIIARLEKDSKLGEHLICQTELYFRSKFIEYNFSEMKVSPAYNPKDSYTSSSPVHQLADVLLIKTEHIGEREMSYWQRIFDLLEVSYDYWESDGEEDTNRLQLFPPFRDEYRGKLLVFPHCDLRKLTSADIVDHFKNEKGSESAMILFLDNPAPDNLQSYVAHKEGSRRVLRHICAGENLVEVPPEMYSGRHLVTPGTVIPVDWTLQRAQRSILKKLEREVPFHLPVITGQSGALKRQGLTYSYGKLSIRRCPLPRTANFQCVDGAASQMMMMGADDPLLTETSRDIPLASNFGQVFLTTLVGLPFHLKMNLLRQSFSKSSPLHVEFILPNGIKLNRSQLTAICLSRDVVDEALTNSSNLERINTIINDACPSNPELLLQTLDLVKREVNQRQTVMGKRASHSFKTLLSTCSSAELRLSSSSTDTGILHLPLLSLLQHQLAILRPHQLTTDELFDLSN